MRAIDDLIADLGRAFDAGPSAEALLPLFTSDARFVIDRYDTFDGSAAIAEGVAGNADSGFCWTLHFLVSPKVALSDDGHRGDVDFYLWEVATSASGRAYWIGGRYLAQVRLDGGRWRFSRLELQADLISHYPEGWKDKPAELAQA
ncbi:MULTISPECIES: nuclear transport factor 2 family protein [Novosphingobium]|uniref:nuclear transport factor 2 family protein n=1 Tax=Novosphingobium TaxID=165696 RepID=UPI0021E5452B|nr:nuclear transport factor 2 family protein [Novosphingobium percolationis]